MGVKWGGGGMVGEVESGAEKSQKKPLVAIYDGILCVS